MPHLQKYTKPPQQVPVDKEEWTVVTANDKKRVMRKRGVRRQLPVGSDDLHTPTGLTSIEKIDDCVKECTKYLCSRQDGIWGTTVQLLRAKGRSNFDEIVCLGIGNFSKTSPASFEAPLWQLSFILALQSELKCSKISFYDPLALPIENEYLGKQLNCAVFESNLRGKYAPSGQALLFLPHCPQLLYENVIAANWGKCEDLCIIGNSLQRIGNNRLFCIKQLLPFYWENALHIRKEELQYAPGNLKGAFNDTYLYWIESVPWDELEKPSSSYDAADSVLDAELF